MPRAIFLLSSLALAVAMSSCVEGDVDGDVSDGSASGCTPGRQTTCACGGGVEGFQLCKGDGSGFGACLGCGDGGAPADTRSADASPDTASPATDTSLATDTTPPIADTATAVDTATGPTWVWLDRGGPAFQPHACPDGPGVTGGTLVDPEAFFAALVKGKSPADWVKVMSDIEPSLWACGVGQQRGSGGDVRGRLFLPTAACPDASPPAGDALAIKLGVRQLPECWAHPADVVDGG
ncbi:MAG: hypothetical protein ABI175_06620 [Polyangiales bacterium]